MNPSRITAPLFLFAMMAPLASQGADTTTAKAATPTVAATPATPPATVGDPADPKTITARAEMLTALSVKEKAELAAKQIYADAQLALAQATHEHAIVRYMEEAREILRKEYLNIITQQAKLQRLIDEVQTNEALVAQLRMGRTGQATFHSMIHLMATSLEFDPIREAFNRPVEKLAVDNFIANDFEDGLDHPVVEFSGGDVRQLMLFVKDNNLSFEPLGDAHFIMMDALTVLSRQAADKVLRLEARIQSARAQRISEVFVGPK